MGDMADNYSPGGMNAVEPDDRVEYFSKLVGVTFEGRQEVIRMLKGDEELRVRREHENQYDPKAVAVDVMIAETWQPIGYIAKDKNKEISAALDAGNEVEISLSSLTGGNDKSFGVNVHLSYEKVKDESKVNSDAKTQSRVDLGGPQSKDGVNSQDSETLAKIKSLLGIKENVIRYESRLLGKSTEVVETNGHITLPGYLSGSKFPDKFYAEFDEKEVLQRMADKFGVDQAHIKAMWNLNREASTGYGTAVHAALENYDTYYKLGDKIKTVKVLKTKTNTGPNKALSRNPFLKKIVEDFHEKFGGDYVRLSEQFVWLHDEKLCGSIDRIKVIDARKKIVRIQDYKTDGDIHEKKYQLSTSPFKKKMGNELLDLHWLQLSFYAYILQKYGYTVEGLDVYWLNPNKLVKGENAWEEFSHEVIDIKEGL